MFSYKKIVLLFLFTTLCVVGVSAQKDKPAPKPTPVFVSAAEKFSINLPEKPQVAKDIKPGESYGVSSGKQYTWGMSEGSISVAYMKFEDPMTSDNDFLSFAFGMKESIEKGNSGKVIFERVDKTGKYRQVEYYFTLPDGQLMLSRWYVSNADYYTVVTALKHNDQSDKDLAVKTMDTFRITGEETPAGKP